MIITTRARGHRSDMDVNSVMCIYVLRGRVGTNIMRLAEKKEGNHENEAL
jgi:hypothetical protein